MRWTSLVLVLLGCQDYNLYRPPHDNTVGDTDAVEGPAPDIEVEPTSLAFGWWPTDCPTDPQTVTIRNVGDATLDVTDISLGGGDQSAFDLVGADTPPSLEPNDEATFQVIFTPPTFRDFDTPVNVSSNDPDEPEVGVDLTGTGAEDARMEDVFNQPSPEKVDVLWIVDNSGSMSEEQGALQDSFDVFINSFVNLGLDYHIAVTTTDMFDPTQSGRFTGTDKVITSDMSTSEAVDAFVQNTSVGTGGSGEETGLAAAHAALTSPLVDGVNSGFMRDDAVLAVVVLSDEDDQSDDPYVTGSIDKYAFIDWMDGLKGDDTMTSLSGIVGAHTGGGLFGMGGCQNLAFPPRTAEAGDIYIDTATATGGQYVDICALDFDQVIQYLSYNAAGLVQSFVLSHTPSSIGDIHVTVNGNDVPYSGINGWSWIAADNAVFFNGDSIPGPNASVVIDYPVDAGCN